MLSLAPRIIAFSLLPLVLHAGDLAEPAPLLEGWPAARAKADRQFMDHFERQICQIRSDRTLGPEARQSAILKTKELRDDFAEHRQLPQGDAMLPATIAYLDTLHQAARPYRRKLDQALVKAEGTPEFDQLSALKRNWQQSFPGCDELRTRTEFHGTRTFLKGNAVDFHLHVLAFDGRSFSGHLWQDVWSVPGKSGWAYKAELEGNQFLLTTTKMLHGQPRTLRFRGYIIERRIVMTLTHLNGEPLTGDLASLWKK